MPTAAGLYYFAHGEEVQDNLPVILIHGAGGNHLIWPPQVRRLNGQRILAVDLPGHGKSEGVGRQAIDEYARAIVDFMKALHLPPAIVVGHSMGSGITLWLALRFPKRVRGLGLVGAGAKLRVAPPTLESAANPSSFPMLVQTVTENSYSLEADPRLKELGAQRMAETRPSVFYGDFLACDAFNVMEKVNKIRVPTLIVCGTEDRMTPVRNSTFLHDQIEGSELRLVEGAGHMVMLEKPDEVANLLENFLESIQSQ